MTEDTEGLGIYTGLIHERRYIVYYVSQKTIYIAKTQTGNPFEFNRNLNEVTPIGLERAGWVALLKTQLGLGDDWIDGGTFRIDSIPRNRVTFKIVTAP